MHKGKNIAVVVPCYNEEKNIAAVLDTMPGFVDKIIAVDDNSRDNTAGILKVYSQNMPSKFINIRHEKNMGVGSAIVTGYKWCLENGIDVAAVMAGDNQMNPAELGRIVESVVEDRTDYCKGNRFTSGKAWRMVSPVRYMGSAVLTLFTKFVSGYWHVSDSQSGFTAVSIDALRKIDVAGIYPGYGMPNDMLVKLNVAECRVQDMPIEPIYHKQSASKMRLGRVMFSIPCLLFRLFFWRMKEKYFIRDFHPLVFFYAAAAALLPAALMLGANVIRRNTPLFGPVEAPLQMGWIILCSLFFISGFQFLLFAMWFDMDYNRHLYIFKEKR